MAPGLKRLLLVCLVAYGWIIHGYLGWNEESHHALTYAIVDGHALFIDTYAEPLGDRAMVGQHYYTDKLPLESFLAVPVYAALRTVLPPVGGVTADTETLFGRYVLT